MVRTAMTPIVKDFSISAARETGYQEAFSYLADALKRQGFETLYQFRLNPAVERKVGLSWKHLGLPWSNYTVLVVWSPPDACQALLSDRDGGLLVPFNVCVAGNDRITVAAVINHYGALIPRDGPVGTRLVIRNLTRKFYQVLQEFSSQVEEASGPYEAAVAEAHLS